MKQEKFAALYEALKENYPEYDFQFDGKNTITAPASVFMTSGIWISAFNDEMECDDASWSVCLDLKEANGQLWERQLNDLDGQRQAVVECVETCIKIRAIKKSLEMN